MDNVGRDHILYTYTFYRTHALNHVHPRAQREHTQCKYTFKKQKSFESLAFAVPYRFTLQHNLPQFFFLNGYLILSTFSYLYKKGKKER